MASVFTKIIQGELPAHKIVETNNYLAFLDIMPVRPGHTLAIPKKEVDYILDLEEDLYMGLWLFAKQVAKAVQKATMCKRIGFSVVGFEVPHVHIHIIPMESIDDMCFSKPRTKASDEELSAMAKKIREALASLS